MKHTWLVGILAGALLAGSAAVQAQQKRVPTRRGGTRHDHAPRAVTADGKPLRVAATRCASQRRRRSRQLLVSYPT